MTSPSRDDIRATQTIMRRVEAHVQHQQKVQGATHERLNMMEVFYHPQTALPHFNYAAPRPKTAWVATTYIQQGLDALRERGRGARVRYMADLYPSVFAQTLTRIGLRLETRIPVLVKTIASADSAPTMPLGYSVQTVTDRQAMGAWWYVWRNAYYDVVTSTARPAQIERDLLAAQAGQQHNLLLYHAHYPIGALRLTLHDHSAHITAMALLNDFHTPKLDTLLRRMAVYHAAQQGCSLIFATGADAYLQTRYREIGFIDSSDILCYAHIGEGIAKEQHESLAQFVPTAHTTE